MCYYSDYHFASNIKHNIITVACKWLNRDEPYYFGKKSCTVPAKMKSIKGFQQVNSYNDLESTA